MFLLLVESESSHATLFLVNPKLSLRQKFLSQQMLNLLCEYNKAVMRPRYDMSIHTSSGVALPNFGHQ